ISVSDGATVKYFRSMDADGTVWNPPQTAFSGTPKQAADLAVAGGGPTVLFYQPSGLYGTHSLDGPVGAVWNSPVQISPAVPASSGFTADEVKVAPVNGMLATMDNQSRFYMSTD